MPAQIDRPYGVFLVFLIVGPLVGGLAFLGASSLIGRFANTSLGIEAFGVIIVVAAAYIVFWIPAGVTGLVLGSRVRSTTIWQAQMAGIVISAAWTLLWALWLASQSSFTLAGGGFVALVVLHVSLAALAATSVCWGIAWKLGLVG